MHYDALHDVPAQPSKDPSLDRRLTVLETRFDTTLTMLPNKADLSELKAELKAGLHGNKAALSELKAELKADIHGESAHLSKWMAATAITTVIGFGSMILTMVSRLPHP
jgi:hypothetical protein